MTKNASKLDELTFTTGAGSRVTAIQTGPGAFEGRIVNGTDYDKKITIANEEVSKRLALTPQKPGANVPPTCAAFFGAWKGYWTRGSFPEMLIHVVEVTPACTARFAFYPNTRFPTSYSGTSDIRDGSFSFYAIAVLALFQFAVTSCG